MSVIAGLALFDPARLQASAQAFCRRGRVEHPGIALD